MRKLLTVFFPIVISFAFPCTAISKDNDTWISETAQEACIEYGEQYGICPELIMAIIERESSGQPDAENGSCKGLMQISVKWHTGRMERLGVTDIFDERGNILVGTDLLAELKEKYVDVAIALMTYHGEKNPAEKEISDYAQGILERSEELERIHENQKGDSNEEVGKERSKGEHEEEGNGAVLQAPWKHPELFCTALARVCEAVRAF